MNEQEYTYDPKEQTMVFMTAARRHIRVAYSDGKVWYCASDIARLIGYRDPSKAVNSLNCEVRILHVPHVSVNRRGITTCNCITKEDVMQFISQQRAYPEVRSWIKDVVIPQAERQFSMPMIPDVRPVEMSKVQSLPVDIQMAAIRDALDRIITEAVLLKREIQCK